MDATLSPALLEKVEKAYDSPPWWYDLRGFLILTFSYRSTLGTQLRFFGPNVSENHLEAAVGTGTLFAMVLRWRARNNPPSRPPANQPTSQQGNQPTCRIVAFDYADAMLAGARKRFAGRGEIQLLRADVARLEFPDASFESANIANAVHCFPDVDAGLREIHRVLVPGGRLAMNALLFPSGIWPLRWIAQRINAWGRKKGILEAPFARAEIEGRVRAAGFEIEEMRISGNSLLLLARKPNLGLPAEPCR